MNAEPPSPVQREGVLLFGRTAAGLSHELSNVFNIINELAGLQQDIVGASEHGDNAAIGRIADLAARIKAQIARGEEFNRLLHKLGHSVDTALVSFDLGEFLELLEGLEARAARLGRVELDVQAPRQPVTLPGDPFALLIALDACVGQVMQGSAADRRLEVSAHDHDAGLRVVVESNQPPAPEHDLQLRESALRLGAAAWRATITKLSEPGVPHGITLEIPLRHPDSAGGDVVSSREEP